MKGTSIIIPSGVVSLNKLRKDAIKAAKEIGYGKDVVKRISSAQNLTEINRILSTARQEWDVNPDRWISKSEEMER